MTGIKSSPKSMTSSVGGELRTESRIEELRIEVPEPNVRVVIFDSADVLVGKFSVPAPGAQTYLWVVP